MFNIDHLHPITVHFPIALITVGLFAEVISLFFKSEKCLSKTGYYLLMLGALSAIAAWSTGQLFTNEPAQGEIVAIFEKHETGALITMILVILGAAFRTFLVIRKKEETSLKWVAFGIYCLSFAAVTYTGLMGGTMVFNFMIGL